MISKCICRRHVTFSGTAKEELDALWNVLFMAYFKILDQFLEG